MTLDEAIKHCDEKAEFLFNKAVMNEDFKCGECAKEHHQLYLWLKELKQLRQALKNIRTEIEALDMQPDGIHVSSYTRHDTVTQILQIIDCHVGEGNKE